MPEAIDDPFEYDAFRHKLLTGKRHWSVSDTHYWPVNEVAQALPPGLYRCMFSHQVGFFLDKQAIDTDELIEFPDTASHYVLDEIKRFWEKSVEFSSRGFLYKRGFLLWGDSGGGKTSTIQIVIKRLVDAGGIALLAGHPENTLQCIHLVRKIEPDRPMVVIMEDIDSLVERYGATEFLSLTDGESHVNNVVFLATSNFPEKLDARFIDRPSRFDLIMFIGMPSANARRLYLRSKEPSLGGDELNQWVALSEGFSIAHLKEMIISNRCFGRPIDEVVARLEEMGERKITSDDARVRGKRAFGFLAERRKSNGVDATAPSR